MKKLNVGFIVPSFPSVSETFIVNQIINLIDNGHDVTIFSLTKTTNHIIHKNILDYKLMNKTIYWEEVKISKIDRLVEFVCFLLKSYNNFNFKKIFEIFNYKKYGKEALNLRNYTRYRWIIRNGIFDIFHAHFGNSGKYVAEMKSFGFFPSTKLVTSFHGYDISPHLFNQYEKNYENLFIEVDLLTVNSIYTRNLLEKIAKGNRIEILPVGLDTQRFKRKRNKNNDEPNLLFVGRLITFKGPDLLLEIARQLIDHGYSFNMDIIGDGEMYSQLEKDIKTYSLHEYINLRGALSQEEILIYMENADIFVFPGIHNSDGRAENQGLVIQEAQAMELPVLISDAGGMRYGIIEGITGFVLEEKNIDSFVEKLKLLIDDKELRKEMGKQGREFVVRNYDSNYLGNRLIELYNRILDE